MSAALGLPQDSAATGLSKLPGIVILDDPRSNRVTRIVYPATAIHSIQSVCAETFVQFEDHHPSAKSMIILTIREKYLLRLWSSETPEEIVKKNPSYAEKVVESFACERPRGLAKFGNLSPGSNTPTGAK